MPKPGIPRTSEHVGEGHPDKFCDQVADHYLDTALAACGADLAKRRALRVAIECLAKDSLIVISGETKLPPGVRIDATAVARHVWARIGYGTDADAEKLTVIDHVQAQSADISVGVDNGGAGDQGIMVGYATDETPERMPREWLLARNLCMKMKELRVNGTLPWMRADCKSQVTIAADGTISSVIIAIQHDKSADTETVRREVRRLVIDPVLGGPPPKRISINGTGVFHVGGPASDAGVVGRKIVVDAYGPRCPVGGGAYSGKDSTKVDRSAAYMARKIAKTVVDKGVAKTCTVTLAYGIGLVEPEMVTAVSDEGEDVTAWVKKQFPDQLSPKYITDSLGLLTPTGPGGWCYLDSAAYGHYGRAMFPWEKT